MHFHDTYGQALANLYAGMEEGARVIDSAAGGLGGCPFAPGALILLCAANKRHHMFLSIRSDCKNLFIREDQPFAMA
jgi:isopropylmalate/homocitrate/citramalate synthase